jgi:hypothetical protein
VHFQYPKSVETLEIVVAAPAPAPVASAPGGRRLLALL